MTSVTYALGALVRPGARALRLGAEHPSQAGLVEIVVTEADGIVIDAEVRPGAIHRCVEKLCEVRDYRQILSLANRHDWHASFVGELGAALVVEAALGLEPPERATWLRTLLAEVSRLGSHLAFLSAVPEVLVADAGIAARLRSVRARLRELTADYTGNRVHTMIVRLGGLAHDIPSGWVDEVLRLAHDCDQVADAVDTLLTTARLPSVAVLGRERIAAHGVTGPAARASGLDLDLRRQQPSLAYADLRPVSVVGTAGDAVARLRQWALEVPATTRLIEQAAARLGSLDGPVGVRLPKVVRVPEGETYIATEGPLGHAGWFLVSRGDKVPWRLKLRTPSFANLSALESLLPGTRAHDLPLAVASLGYVVGDVAK